MAKKYNRRGKKWHCGKSKYLLMLQEFGNYKYYIATTGQYKESDVIRTMYLFDETADPQSSSPVMYITYRCKQKYEK